MNDLVVFDAGEKPLLVVRKHWIIFVRDVLASILAALIPFLLWALAARLGLIPDMPVVAAGAAYLGSLWLLVVWITIFVLWTEYFLDVWIITDRRIFNIQQVGLFHRQSSSCEIENVQEIVVHTDNFLQTLLHYGTVRIQTAGPSGEYITAEGVPHPERVRAAIQAQTSTVSHLEEKNKKQQELLHMVAHEVKGYLGKNAAVLASIVEGDYGNISDPLKNTAVTALSSTRTGVNTVMEILEGSNLETGTVHYERVHFDLKASVRTVCDAVRPLADEKKLVFALAEDPRPCFIEGDRSKIENHVLRNIIENAIRYTPQGSVSVGVTIDDDRAIVYTQDTGVGISPEDMSKLFTEGGHGAESRKVNPSSTGFGLFIAKQIVDAHGGHMWAESAGTGTGSRFFVVLPLSTQQ